MGRRAFLLDLGHGAAAVAVVGLAACTAEEPAASPGTSATRAPSTPGVDGTAAASASVDAGGSADALRWGRVDLGFVSAYVLVRAGEASVVDTGVSGSEGAIEAGLTELGVTWADVGSVILTHLHPDHAGSSSAVLVRAADAAGYAGAADLPAISAPRPLLAVGDGERVSDLAIIATPGHTAGHIAVLDDVAGVLVAGDALNTADGAVQGPNPQFSDDMATAEQSVRKLAGFTFDTLLVGHGDPIVGDAAERLADYLAGS
jgi:glyoxylase-like metal-dependent hydrolase (beta-lactamase superfamily II)